MQGFKQSRSTGGQFGAVVNDQFAYNLFPSGREHDQHFTAIVGSALPANQAAVLQAVNQFYRTVMLNLKLFSQFRNSGSHRRRQPFQSEEQLVLAGLQVGVTDHFFAETQIAADLMAKF